jgi:glycine oxidase
MVSIQANKPLGANGTARLFMDTLIIGAGAIGLSVAYELAQRGEKVGVVERADVGRESSWAGAGIVPPAPTDIDASPSRQLAALSARLHPEWHARLKDETGIDNGYRCCGALYLADDDKSERQLADEVEAWRSAGVRHDAVDPNRLAEVEPNLSAAGVRRAVHLPDEAQLRNPWHVRALQSACASRGVVTIVRSAVEEFVVRDGSVAEVRTSNGPLSAGKYCLTAGAWTGELAAKLGLRPAVKPIRGQIVLLNPERPLVRGIVYAGDNFRHYFVARDDGRVLVGSTEEDVGFDKRTTASVGRELLDFAIRLAPALADAQVEQSWAGLRPFSADGMPYLGRAPELKNFYVAAGHYRWGLALSPATAVVMAQLMRGEPTALDLADFRLDR